MAIEEVDSEEKLAKKRRAVKKGSSDNCIVFPPSYISRGRGGEHGVDHPIFVDVLPSSTSEAVPQNEEGLIQEANVPESKVESGDEDWSIDNVLEEELGSDFDELFEL
ncbi:hypothetical protein Ancab_035589 [Ancistrocladus abbreviatus]